jgi:hypothetical protein
MAARRTRAQHGRVTIHARLLIVAGDGGEPTLAAVRQTLDHAGTPYDVVMTASPQPSTTTSPPSGLPRLSDGEEGFYQAVLVTTGAVPPDILRALDAYEAAFGVRRAWLDARPDGAGLGLVEAVDTGASPLVLRYTAEGSALFSWYATATPVEVRGVPARLARAPDGAVRPLLVDDAGRVAVAIRRLPDGREALLVCFEQSPTALHSLRLLPGVVAWVTRGLHLGERRAHLAAQIDDVFRASALWGGGGETYRMTGGDLRGLHAWQRARRAEPLTAGLRLSLACNCEGAGAPGDDLTAAAREVGSDFFWISHTYRHLALDGADEATTRDELARNDAAMAALGFGPHDPRCLVTPEVSGLENPAAMRAIAAAGVRYVVSDSSRPGYDNPSPNLGIASPLAPSVLMIPRRPTSLFYDVSTPAAWVAAYNARYRAHWGRDLGFDDILEQESDTLLGYLLRGDGAPWMFHQANLRAYDGARSLLTDLLDRVLAKYARYFTLPVVSLPMQEIGRRMADRMQRAATRVSAVID